MNGMKTNVFQKHSIFVFQRIPKTIFEKISFVLSLAKKTTLTY